jgi:hypothetical protein
MKLPEKMNILSQAVYYSCTVYKGYLTGEMLVSKEYNGKMVHYMEVTVQSFCVKCHEPG